METKKILRAKMKEKLSLMAKENFTEKSSLISKNLAFLFSSLNIIQNKDLVGAYAPISLEPLWFQETSGELDSLIAYPAIGDKSDLMIFKMARMSDLVIKKDFGFEILGPPTESPEVTPRLILIPGLAFTELGERLGRGKGFYDKYLSHFRGIKIGVCFSEQVVEMLPTEKHDVTLDYIVTDEKIINCSDAKKYKSK